MGLYPAAYTLFSGITIPQGTTITSATLRINICQSSPFVALNVFADNRNTPVPNPTTILNMSNVLLGSKYISGGTSLLGSVVLFTKTNGTTANPADYVEGNINVTSFVQALVNLYNYNNSSIMFKYTKSLDTPFVYAKDFGATKAPKLIISYTPATQTLQNKTIYEFV